MTHVSDVVGAIVNSQNLTNSDSGGGTCALDVMPLRTREKSNFISIYQ